MLYHNIQIKSSGFNIYRKIEKLRFRIRLIEPEEELKNQHHPESIIQNHPESVYVDLLEHRFSEKTVDNKKVGDGVTDFVMWFLKLCVMVFQICISIQYHQFDNNRNFQ